MPRDANGLYTLPPRNPVISGTVISSDWANPTMGDIANEMTDSLSRSGEGGMLAPLRLVQGSAGVPGIAWTAEITSGFYLAASQDVRLAMGGVDVVRFAGNMAGGRGGVSTQLLRATSDALADVATTEHGLQVGGNVSVRVGRDSILAAIAGVGASLRVQDCDGSLGLGKKYNSWIEILNYSDNTGSVSAAHSGETVWITTGANLGGLQVKNLATGVGFERVLTTSDIPAGGGSDNEFPGPNPTLSNSNAAIIIGTDTPDIAFHIAAGPNVIQAKGSATTANNLDIQPLGGYVTLWAEGQRRVSFSTSSMALTAHTSNLTSNYINFRRQDGIAPQGGGVGYYFGNFTLDSGSGTTLYLVVPSPAAEPNKGATLGPVGTLSAGNPLIGLTTPAVRLGSTNPAFEDGASPTSTLHPFQIGLNSPNLRMSAQRICTNQAGFSGALYIQDGPTHITRIGSYSNTGTYLETDGAVVAINHANQQVLRSTTPANGGVLVNGLYGLQRVLTLGDLPSGGGGSNVTARVTSVDTNVVNTTALTPIPELTLTLDANQRYTISAQLFVDWPWTNVFATVRFNTTNSSDIFQMTSTVVFNSTPADSINTHSPNNAFQSYYASFMNLNSEGGYGYYLTFTGSIAVGASSSTLTVNLQSDVAVSNILKCFKGAFITATKVV